MKKGAEISVHLLVMVIFFIVIVIILMGMGSASVRTPIESMEKECTSSLDCNNNINGTLCINIGAEGYRCGCLSDMECDQALKCIDNTCR